MELSTHYLNGTSIFSNDESKWHRKWYEFVDPEKNADNLTTSKNFRLNCELAQGDPSDSCSHHVVAEIFLQNNIEVAPGEVGNYEFWMDPLLCAMTGFQSTVHGNQYEMIQKEEIINNMKHALMAHKNKFDYIDKYTGAQSYRTGKNEFDTVTMSGGDKFTYTTPLALFLTGYMSVIPTNLYGKLNFSFNLVDDQVYLGNLFKFPATGFSTLSFTQRLIIQYHKIHMSPPQSLSFATQYYESKQYSIGYSSTQTINITKDFTQTLFPNAIFVSTTVAAFLGGKNSTNSMLSGFWRDLNIKRFTVSINGAEVYKSNPFDDDQVHIEMLIKDQWTKTNRDEKAVSAEPNTSIYSTNRHPYFRIDLNMLWHDIKSGDSYLGKSPLTMITNGKLELNVETGPALVPTSLTAGHTMEVITRSSRLSNIRNEDNRIYLTHSK
jgi:hypothetical protein